MSGSIYLFQHFNINLVEELGRFEVNSMQNLFVFSEALKYPLCDGERAWRLDYCRRSLPWWASSNPCLSWFGPKFQISLVMWWLGLHYHEKSCPLRLIIPTAYWFHAKIYFSLAIGFQNPLARLSSRWDKVSKFSPVSLTMFMQSFICMHTTILPYRHSSSGIEWFREAWPASQLFIETWSWGR